MKRKLEVLFIMIGLLFISGCSDTILINDKADKSLSDYSFIDYAYNCSVYSGNVFDIELLNLSSSVSFVWFDSNWSLMACKFNSKCVLSNSSIVSNICSNNQSGWVNLNTVFVGGSYKVLCCSSGGVNCYVDSFIDINVPSSVCDLNYTQLTTSLVFNNVTALWDAVCCVNGVE